MFSTMTCVRNMPPSNSLQTRCVRWGSRNSGGTGVAACFYPLHFEHAGPPTAPPELAEPHSNTETWLSPRPVAGGATPDARRKETPDNGRCFTNKQAPAERFLTRQIRPPCRHSSGAREDARWAPEARPWGQPCGGRAEPAPRMHLTRPARHATAQASDGLAAVPRGHAAGSRPPPARRHCCSCTAPRPGKGRTPPARHAGQRHRGARAPRGRGGACLWDFGLAGPSLLRGSGPGSVALPRSPATPTH